MSFNDSSSCSRLRATETTLSLDRCFAAPQVKAVLIDPLVTNKRAVAYYEKMEFEFVEARTLDEVLSFELGVLSFEF